MSPSLQEESLVDRETDSSALTLATCSAWMAAPAVARSWAAHRAARKVYRLEFSGENFSEVFAATTALLVRGFAICVILFACPLHLFLYTCPLYLETKEGGCPVK